MKDKEKQNISMKEMLTKRSVEPITNCNCKIESRIDYAVRKNEDNTGSMVDLLNQEQSELQKAMIEEIKSIIDERCEAELGQVHASSMGGKVTKTVSTKLIAKDIYEYLTENSVVLSREEWRKYVDNENEAYYRGQHEAEVYYKNIQIPRERKETAEKDFNTIIKALEERKERVKAFYGVAESVGVDIAIRTVNELAKQFGVEIKE